LKETIMVTSVQSGDRYSDHGGAATGQASAPRPTEVAQANVGNTLNNIGEALKPDAIVFGESHKISNGLRGGNFGLISTKDGSVSYFGAKPIGTVNLGPLGTAGVSVVGTNGAKGDEAGVGLTWKVPTPAGDMLMFANVRQDGATVGNLLDNIQGKGQGTFTASVNVGAAYSVSDGAALLLSNSAAPGSGIVTAAALELAGADAWVGAGWRGQATFEGGQLKSINISGVEIPAERFGEVFGGAVQQQRQSPTLLPNLGRNDLASLNDNIQLAFGQSPWDVGFSAMKRDGAGALEIRNGTVDVRNHGNNVTAVTEPIYELGVKYGALAPGQRVTSNTQAGQVIDQVLNRALASDQANEAGGKPTQQYVGALNRLMNPYNLSFGSQQLDSAYRSFQSSGASQTLTNTSRVLQGLDPLPVAGQSQRPSDYGLVRSTFQGELRWPADNPQRPQFPQGGFRL
jgi:hypothetical protein